MTTENETITETTTAPLTEAEQEQQKAQEAQRAREAAEATNAERLSACLDECVKYIAHCKDLSFWLGKYSDRLVGLNWTASHIYPEVQILIGGYGSTEFEQDARKIARRFPGVVWRREKDEYTCGVLNWKTIFDGMRLEIHHAEKIRWIPEPNTAVDPDEPAPANVEPVNGN